MSDLSNEFMYGKEAAEYLRTTERKIAMFRKHGLLKSAKYGKNYVYRVTWLNEFSEEWAGYDLSNEERLRLAVNSRKWKENHR